MCRNVVVVGAGGHAKVIADIIIKNGDKLVGFLDDHVETGTIILRHKVLNTIGNIEKYIENEFIIGIGNNEIRRKIAEEYRELKYYPAIHPNAVIGIDVEIEEGTVVMAGAVINPCASIGKHVIINTGAIIEHDNVIKDYVHISPNVALGGTVQIGEMTHVGIGAVVKNNVKIGERVTVGAGAVVVKDIMEVGTYIGVPTRKVR